MAFLLAIIWGFVDSSQVAVRAQTKRETKNYFYYLQSKKYYKVSDVAKIRKRYGSLSKAEKNSLTNPDIKWTSKSKQIIVKNKRFMVKKPGVYQLTGRYNSKKKVKKYVIKIYAFDKEPDLIPEDVSKITIQKLSDRITITDPKEISLFRQKFNSAQYCFDIKNSNWSITGWNYWIRVYSGSGELVCNFTTISSRSINIFRGAYYLSAKENTTQEYAAELFDKYFVPPNLGN